MASAGEERLLRVLAPHIDGGEEAARIFARGLPHELYLGPAQAELRNCSARFLSELAFLTALAEMRLPAGLIGAGPWIGDSDASRSPCAIM